MSESVVTHLIGRGLEEKELWVERSKKEKLGVEGVQRKCHKFLLELTCPPFFCVKDSCNFHSVLVHSRAIDPPDLMQSPLWAAPVFACPGRRPTEILWKVA